ncbi:hypothetical protein [Rubinisphaera margarita]|uniref:hypothetical protein n=1 Tax=Rubinisphaera margarita TaxID=2909586 RepID=UPI001EE7DAF9|nr:hypothetical protein [Rubinisphaera margarita]MCG6157171.1 hypothetical protein [Rubinisphaera margarita]
MWQGDSISFWIGGILFGLGSGLVIARSLPMPPEVAAHAEEQSPSLAESAHLASPISAPLLTEHRFRRKSPPPVGGSIEPGRFVPPSNAMPVSEAKPVKPAPAATPEKPEFSSSTTFKFREELESISDGISEEALNELTRIRDSIEAETESEEKKTE